MTEMTGKISFGVRRIASIPAADEAFGRMPPFAQPLAENGNRE
jgi:hypothetical protein